MDLGLRIIYNQEGEVICYFSEQEGAELARKNADKLYCIDLPYGEKDWSKYYIIGVNVETKQPILQEVKPLETEEQRRIRELEDALLLQVEADIGGIL